VIDAVYRTESRRVLATLIRLLGAALVAQPPLEDRPPQLAIDLAAEISAADEADVEAH